MQGYCIIHFEHSYDVSVNVKFCEEKMIRKRVFSVKFDHACDVSFMFKINNTIVFQGKCCIKYRTKSKNNVKTKTL